MYTANDGNSFLAIRFGPMRVAVELCATSITEVHLATELGLDSVELCSWLACGGVTPGMGLLHEATRSAAPRIRALVRPHGGGFHYSPAEIAVMRADIEALRSLAPIPEPVVGMLAQDGMPDIDAFRSTLGAHFLQAATFHRALDHCPDPLQGFEQLVQAGVGRVLTSGGSTLAQDGTATLRAMVAVAGSGTLVAIAGGISPANVVRIVEATGAREIHFAAQKPLPATPGLAAMSSAQGTTSHATEPDRAKIEGVLDALVKAGMR